MKPEKPTEKSTDAADLRRRAQARLQSQTPPPKVSGSTEELQRLVQELQTHQIELEMQNEDIREVRARLEASATRYTNLYDFAPVSYFTVGLKGEIIQANLAGARLLGLERSRLLDYRFDAFVVSADLPAFRTLLTRAFATQSPETIEVRLAIKDKPPVTVLLHACVSADGLESRLVLTDITERRQAEEQLGEHRVFLDKMLECTHAGTWRWNVQTGQAQVSARWAEILGYTLAELAPITIQTWLALVHPADLKNSDAARDAHFNRTTDIYECEFRMKHKDGSWVWMEDRGRVVEWTSDNKPLLMAGTHLDITERKQAEVALRASEEKHRLLFENAGDVLFIISEEGQILDANPVAVKLLGYTRPELMSMTLHQIDSLEDRLHTADRIARLIQEGHLIFEAVFQHKDGSLIPIDVNARRIVWDGKPAFLSICRDITERKQAEAAVREGEANLRAILEASPVAMVVNDEHDNMTFLNRRFTESFGYTLADIPTVAAWWPRAFPDPAYRRQVAQEWQAAIEKAHREGTALESEDHRVTCKDGSVRDIRFSLAPLGTSHVVILHDITERKQEEEALRRSAHANEFLCNSIVALNACPDLDSSLACLAQKAVELGGMDCSAVYLIEGQDAMLRHHVGLSSELVEQVARRPLSTPYLKAALEHPEEIVNLVTRFPEQYQVGKAHGLRCVYYIVLRAEQRAFGFLAVASLDPEPPTTSDLDLIRILTLETQSLFLRLTVEQRLRSIQAAMAEGLVVQAADGAIIDCNPSAEMILGLSRDQILGRQVVDPRWQAVREDGRVFPGEEHPAMVSLRTGQSCRDVVMGLNLPDGSQRWININAEPMLKTGEALPYAVLTSFADITERKQAEAEKERLEAQNRQLQKAESLGRMAGAIAHNFNNKLAAVTMNLELLQRELPPNAGSGLDLSTALQSAREAAKISTQMLVYLGQTHVQRETLDLSEVCRRSLPLLEAGIPHTVVLKTDLPALGPVIQANANQIQQVLTNLLTNAWEASSRPGDGILVTVKLAPAAGIPATHRFPVGWQPQDSAYACLEVADSGCGITAENLERIFDPFYTSKFTGRGLGLAVVLGIVRGYDGGITVESEPGQGSVFRVFLPVSAAAILQEPIPVAPAPKTAGRGAVLVVEDELPLRATVTRALQRYGYTVLAAADGVEAVELFEQHQDEIHCVLCDLTMPRMDGWETLTALRKLAPGIPVILSSGYDDAKVMEGHHTELPQALLHKPYDLKALFDLVKRFQPEVPGKKRE